MQCVHVVWFKRDLRVHDHRPLAQAAREARARLYAAYSAPGAGTASRQVLEKHGSRKPRGTARRAQPSTSPQLDLFA